MMQPKTTFVGCMLLMTALATALPAQQLDFRVETDVYVGEGKQPVQQTLTLFSDSVYYDFLFDPQSADSASITLVDPSRNRVILLDTARRVQTHLNTAEVLAYLEKARSQASGTHLAIFLQQADEIEYDAETETVKVGQPPLEYRATMQEPRDEGMAERYAEFADWVARINSVFEPPFTPPYARLNLNAEIAQRKMLPEEITRTTTAGDEQLNVRCRLLTNWRLSKDDQAKITRVGEMLQIFEQIEPTEFFSQRRQAARQQAEQVEQSR